MSILGKHEIAVVGGPESGKTTWLGSLLDAVQQETSRVLQIPPGGWPQNARAIELLVGDLVDGRYPKRTPKEQEVQLAIGLRAAHEALGQREFQLAVSDYAGEQLDRLFEHRTRGWNQAWRTRANAVGLLIFIRPDASLPLPRAVHMAEGSPWAQALSDSPEVRPPTPRSLDPITPEDLFPAIADEVPEVPAPSPNEPVKIPSVLALIEMLQFLRAERGYDLGYRPNAGTMRIGIVVSAWDAVPPEWRHQGPGHYLAEHMPLFEQFLWSNFKADDVFRFGLSATGGDLRDPKYRQRYIDEPLGWCEWSGIDGQTVRSTEIALPLLWTLFGDSALSVGVDQR